MQSYCSSVLMRCCFGKSIERTDSKTSSDIDNFVFSANSTIKLYSSSEISIVIALYVPSIILPPIDNFSNMLLKMHSHSVVTIFRHWYNSCSTIIPPLSSFVKHMFYISLINIATGENPSSYISRYSLLPVPFDNKSEGFDSVESIFPDSSLFTSL